MNIEIFKYSRTIFSDIKLDTFILGCTVLASVICVTMVTLNKGKALLPIERIMCMTCSIWLMTELIACDSLWNAVITAVYLLLLFNVYSKGLTDKP